MKLSETQAKVLARIIFTGSASWSSANDRTRDSLIRLNLAAEYHAHTLLLIPTALGVRAYADHIDEEPMMIAARVMGRIEDEAYAEKAERERSTERFAYPNDIVTATITFSVVRIEGDQALIRPTAQGEGRAVWVPVDRISPASLPMLPGGTTRRS